MKLIIVILTVFLVQVSASTHAQQLTLKDNHILLKEVFQQIRKQTDYTVLYKSNVINKAKPISLDLHKVPLDEALKKILDGQNLDYTIKNKAIFISEKETPSFLEKLVEIFAPPVDVRGLVLDEKGQPLVGASVRVKDLKQAAVTDNEGKFYLAGVDEKAVLLITYIGYVDKEVGVKASVSVTLQLKSAELEEVVIAYGKTTQQALTGAVTVVKGEQVRDLPFMSVDKALQGLVPGLLVSSGSGQPGSGLSNFVLRGISTGGDATFNQSVRSPLIVIDGIPVSQDNYINGTAYAAPVINPMAQLNTSDIESISVLKDAAAIALYGSKASNGVILVTTKKGKAGKTQISFRNQTDIARRLKGKIQLLNQQEYLELLYETYTNSGYSKDAVRSELYKAFPVRVNNGDTSFYASPNWEDELFTKTSSTISNDLSISGGNDKTTFYLNLEYSKQNGTVKRTDYDRKSLRINVDNNVSDWIKLGLNSTFSYNVQNYANDIYRSTIANSPLNPIRYDDGSYVLNFDFPSPAYNPIAGLEYNVNRNTSFRGLTHLSAEARFLKHFQFSTKLGADFMLIEGKELLAPGLFDINFFAIGDGRIESKDIRTANLISTNLLRYNQTIGKEHSVDFLISQEAQIQNTKNSSGRGTKLTVPNSLDLSNALSITATGFSNRQTLLSYFGQANYAYKNRYLLSSTIRKDGSSLFGEKNRFGTYWSIGTGWIISSEPFMKRIEKWINYLKVRGSIGAAGNSAAIVSRDRYDLLGIFKFLNERAVFSETAGNPTIQWEQTFSWDAGLEARIMRNRIEIGIDVYKKYSKNLIELSNVPLSTGYHQIRTNIGDIENRGIELSLSASIINNAHYKWNISGNWSVNQNVLVKANSDRGTGAGNLINLIGKNYGSFVMRRWAGVNPDNGKPQWLDENGKVVEVYPVSLKSTVYVGKPQPDGFGSLNTSFDVKNFQLSASFYYQYGFQIYNDGSLTNDGSNFYANQDIRALDRWQKPGDLAANPKRILYNFDASSQSTRFLYNGDYIRLQHLTLSYQLPSRSISRLGLQAVTLSAKAFNLVTWTKFPGGDPSNTDISGANGLSYPNQKSYSLGINVNF